MRQSRAQPTVQPVDDAVSFADVYDAHVHEVYRFVHRRCRDHQLAEDITQETFMAAIRSTSEPATVTIAWLITVARNRLFDALRRQLNYEDKLRLLASGKAEAIEFDIAERLRVERALSELRIDHRIVLTMHYLDGFTVPAVAEELGRSVKSIEGLVTRARRELATRLDTSSDEGGL